jgi:nucleotide-binding universal stress UspA family protein
MGRIMVATDGSRGSEAAIAEGIDLAQRLGAEVTFAAVRPPVPDYLGEPLYQEHLREDLARARRALQQARDQAEQAGIEAEYELLEGDPAEEIARLAEARDADLVVVGTRGIGAVAGSLLGSVSSGVIRRSHRPVVVVREPGEHAREEAAEREEHVPSEVKPATR